MIEDSFGTIVGHRPRFGLRTSPNFDAEVHTPDPLVLSNSTCLHGGFRRRPAASLKTKDRIIIIPGIGSPRERATVGGT